MLEEAPQTSEAVGLYSADAARVLRITAEAVRSRIERGTLNGRRDNTGHWLV
jgi:DNA-directed RNA polymerase specialized sigma24 family protein